MSETLKDPRIADGMRAQMALRQKLLDGGANLAADLLNILDFQAAVVIAGRPHTDEADIALGNGRATVISNLQLAGAHNLANKLIQTWLKKALEKGEEEGQQFTLPADPSYRDFDHVIELAYDPRPATYTRLCINDFRRSMLAHGAQWVRFRIPAHTINT
jgi:hypothetical protein